MARGATRRPGAEKTGLPPWIRPQLTQLVKVRPTGRAGSTKSSSAATACMRASIMARLLTRTGLAQPALAFLAAIGVEIVIGVLVEAGVLLLPAFASGLTGWLLLARRSPNPPKTRFAPDSPLEGTRFEPSVPPSGGRRFRVSPIRLCGTSRSAGKTGPFWDRDRRFESGSLHRRVRSDQGAQLLLTTFVPLPGRDLQRRGCLVTPDLACSLY
jgi:hypothetical protein